MAGWTDMLMNILKLTDEVKRMNKDIGRVEEKLSGMNDRLIRVETRLDTYVEIAQTNRIESN